MLDTGASLSLASESTVRQLDVEIDKTPPVQLNGFSGGTAVASIGSALLLVVAGTEEIPIKFEIVRMKTSIIIGYPIIKAMDWKMDHGEFLNSNWEKIGDENEELRESAYETIAEVKPSFEQNLDTVLQASSSNILSVEQSSRLRRMLNTHKAVFETGAIGAIPAEKFIFKQSFVSMPPAMSQWPISDQNKNVIQDEIQKMVVLGVLVEDPTIEVVTSNFLVVKKKDGGPRAVCDLRAVNSITVLSNQRLPRIDDIVQDLSGKKFFASLDLTKAYWSISVEPSQTIYYTVQCPKSMKTYRYVRMPMGALNSSVAFQSLIEKVLEEVGGDVKSVVVRSYIDDINLGADNIDDLLEYLERLLCVFERNSVRVNLRKCSFAQKHADLFGFRVSEDGSSGDPKRVESLLELPFPESKKKCLQVLAKLNYLRSLIRGFSILACDLYKLATGEEFNPTQEHRASFEEIKSRLAERVQLAPISSSDTFILETDASIRGTSAVLKQRNKHGEERIVAITSSGLVGAQAIWDINQLECLGCFRGVSKFERLLDGVHFIYRTDNRQLFLLLSAPLDKVKISRRTPSSRHFLYLSSFSFTPELVSGSSSEFGLTDLLSRESNFENQWTIELGASSKKPLIELNKRSENDIVASVSEDSIEQILKKTLGASSIKDIHERVKLSQVESKHVQKLISNLPKTYTYEENGLFILRGKSKLLVVPPHFARSLLLELHSILHPSARKMIVLCSALKLYISKKYKIILQITSSCNVCAPARSHAAKKELSISYPDPKFPWQTVAADLWNFQRKCECLVLVDAFSKFVLCEKLEEPTSKCILNTLLKWFSMFGLPEQLGMDNGANISANEVCLALETLGIVVRKGSPYNSRSNANAERSILKFQNHCRIVKPSFEELDTFIQIATYRINFDPTGNGALSPAQKFFSRSDPTHGGLPSISQNRRNSLSANVKQFLDQALEIRNTVIENNRRARQLFANGADEPSFKKNDRVRVKNYMKSEHKKTFNPWTTATFKVIKVNPHCKTALLQEECEDSRRQPARILRSFRFIKKVHFPNKSEVEAEEDDAIPTDELLEKSSLVENATQEMVQKKVEKLIEMKNERHNQELITNSNGNYATNNGKNTHRMTLRKRH